MTDAPFTTLADLTELVQVQPEATVSRTVFRAAGVRVVVFAFDAGQELTEHTAAMPVLLQVLSGALTITADGRSDALALGGLMHLDARVPHAVRADEPAVLMLTMLDAR